MMFKRKKEVIYRNQKISDMIKHIPYSKGTRVLSLDGYGHLIKGEIVASKYCPAINQNCYIVKCEDDISGYTEIKQDDIYVEK